MLLLRVPFSLYFARNRYFLSFTNRVCVVGFFVVFLVVLNADELYGLLKLCKLSSSLSFIYVNSGFLIWYAMTNLMQNFDMVERYKTTDISVFIIVYMNSTFIYVIVICE